MTKCLVFPSLQSTIIRSKAVFTAHPSLEFFTENVKRAHIQTCVWKNKTQSQNHLTRIMPTTHGKRMKPQSHKYLSCCLKCQTFSFRPRHRQVVKSKSTARAEDGRGGKHGGLIREVGGSLPRKCLNYGRLHGRFSCILDAFGARIRVFFGQELWQV